MGNDLQTTSRRPRSMLHPYQERGAKWIVDHDECGLFMDVGLGKTVTTLTAITDLKEIGQLRHALVIGPPRVVSTVWAKEADIWEHTRGLTVLVLNGSPDKRRQRLKDQLAGTDVVCISFSMLPWLHQTVRRETWDMVIVDESSLIKNSTTKRWKAVAYTAMTAKRRVILTGTPTPKSLADLWGQVSVADLGKRFGKSREAFLRRYFLKTDAGWQMRPNAAKAIMGKVKGFAVSMLAKDYLDLPRLIDVPVAVSMPDSAWDLYDELAAEFSAELTSGAVIDVANAGVMVGKLQQVAQGALFTDGAGKWEELHRAKIDALTDLVSEMNGEPVLIAYWFKHDLARLRELFPDAPVLGSSMSPKKLEQLIERWNSGAVPVLLLHPASAGHGLNLQAGGRHLIWFAIPWSWELSHQTVARLYRQGQTKPVMVYRVVATGTIDERILEVLAQRQGTHDTVVSILKADVAAATSRISAKEALKDARAAMQRAHPDRGGSDQAFIAARKRYESLKRDFDLAA